MDFPNLEGVARSPALFSGDSWDRQSEQRGTNCQLARRLHLAGHTHLLEPSPGRTRGERQTKAQARGREIIWLPSYPEQRNGEIFQVDNLCLDHFLHFCPHRGACVPGECPGEVGTRVPRQGRQAGCGRSGWLSGGSLGPLSILQATFGRGRQHHVPQSMLSASCPSATLGGGSLLCSPGVYIVLQNSYKGSHFYMKF